MQNACMDNYSTTFNSFPMIMDYHREQNENSQWLRCKIKDLKIEPLNEESVLYSNPDRFASGISEDAVKDTAKNLGLAITVEGSTYPMRSTAYKTMLDRAKINGSSLPKLERPLLARVVNDCLNLSTTDALVLIRDEKVAAIHSGDEADYSVLPIKELLNTLQAKLDERFPGNQFDTGYSDHAITSASWSMAYQRDDLLATYSKLLDSNGKGGILRRMMPGVRFTTSDIGISSAKVSALLIGNGYSIHIGDCINIDHRNKKTVADFDKALDQLFAQYEDGIRRLEELEKTVLSYPVNAMTRICKKLCMPKKQAIEAIARFEITYGGGSATAHDVFFALQEIPYQMRCEKAPESKLIALEENMARALKLNWRDYDLAKAVDY